MVDFFEEYPNSFFPRALLEKAMRDDDMKMFNTEAQKATHQAIQAEGFQLGFTLDDNGTVYAFYVRDKEPWVFRIMEDGRFQARHCETVIYQTLEELPKIRVEKNS